MDMCKNKKSNLLHPVPILATPTGAGYGLQKLLNLNLFLFSEKSKLFSGKIEEIGNILMVIYYEKGL
jgi:hypothetical protein